MPLNYSAVLPEILLVLGSILCILLIPILPNRYQVKLGYIATLILLGALTATLFQWGSRDLAFFGMISIDPLGHFCKLIFLLSSTVVCLISISYLKQEGLEHGEFFPLLLMSTTGMSLMAVSADLIMTFLGLEILSISTYALAGFRIKDPKSNESALKYFLLGAFSTSFLLYGIALTYGATGTTKYAQISQALNQAHTDPRTLLLGLGLLLVGFGFKAALVPFHIWAPDVYQGAPIPITAHLAVGSKAAALLALLRILSHVFSGSANEWQDFLGLVCILTMVIGNVAALTQSNIKRLLAYSSIAHAGYVLLGIVANSPQGTQSVLFYLFAYSGMTLGAFTVVQVISGGNERSTSLDAYRGIGYSNPVLSISLTIFLLSLAGIPLTSGFYGKLFLFSAAIGKGMYGLVITAALASAVGLYYYMRIVVLMFMEESADPLEPIPLPMTIRIVILVLVAGTLFLGIYPTPILSMAGEAAGL